MNLNFVALRSTPTMTTMAELENDTQAEVEDLTILETREEAAFGAANETAPEDEADDEDEDGEQKQQQQRKDQKNDDKFGMLVLAGEVKEYDPNGNNPRTFE